MSGCREATTTCIEISMRFDAASSLSHSSTEYSGTVSCCVYMKDEQHGATVFSKTTTTCHLVSARKFLFFGTIIGWHTVQYASIVLRRQDSFYLLGTDNGSCHAALRFKSSFTAWIQRWLQQILVWGVSHMQPQMQPSHWISVIPKLSGQPTTIASLYWCGLQVLSSIWLGQLDLELPLQWGCIYWLKAKEVARLALVRGFVFPAGLVSCMISCRLSSLRKQYCLVSKLQAGRILRVVRSLAWPLQWLCQLLERLSE